MKLKEDQHLKLYHTIVKEIVRYERRGGSLQELADDAKICTTTLNNWLNYWVICPHLRTLFNVAFVLGYDLTLVKRKVKLRKVS